MTTVESNKPEVPEEPGSNPVPVLTRPCPFCHHVWHCPFVHRPRDECLDLWPLGNPARRKADVKTTQKDWWKEHALQIPGLQEILKQWESGEPITDDQYLKLRAGLLDEMKPASSRGGPYLFVLEHVLTPRVRQHILDAKDYYCISQDQASQLADAAAQATMYGVLQCSEHTVTLGAVSPVQSHFEWLFSDSFKLLFAALLDFETLPLPSDDKAFQDGFEKEWRRLLRYGNGHYGFSVVPLISLLDMVHYQELGGRDKVVSCSVANYVMWTMAVFPPIEAVAIPEFRENVFKKRILQMFEPLVRACAWQVCQRAWHQSQEKANQVRLAEQFRAVLSGAIDEYDFMCGKEGRPEDGVGIIGFSADPSLREAVDQALQALGIPINSYELTHIGVAHFLSARLRRHLREHYPPTARDSAGLISTDAPSTDEDDERIVEGIPDDSDPRVSYTDVTGLESVGAEAYLDSIERPIQSQPSSAQLPTADIFACDVGGIKYLFVDEMAAMCGVTREQLRSWDKSGELLAPRLRDILPASRNKVSGGWRVYPHTPEMIEEIRSMAATKAVARGVLPEDEYTRSQAATALGRSYRTLQRWENKGIAKPVKRGGWSIYTGDEIRRIAGAKGRKET